MNFIPDVMKSYKQWMVGTKNEKGEYKVPSYWHSQYGVIKGDPTNPACYMTYEDAMSLAGAYDLSVGFALTENDPFAVIDLDVKDSDNEPSNPHLWTTPEQLRRFEHIIATFDSYSEVSSSGKGVHIIVYGNTESGVKRDGVEVYSKGRFIVCTGNSMNNPAKPIVERQLYLQMLVDEIVQARKDSKIDLEEIEPTESDEDIWIKASTADNSDKFNILFEGRWQELNYQSQSEADLALMSMFTFYSDSNEQCRRLFRYSELGKREKAVKDNRYIDLTISLCRARQQREKIELQQVEQQAIAFVQNLNNSRDTLENIQQLASQELPIVTTNNNVVIPEVTTKGPKSLSWPPGLAGEIAKFIYHSSMRPVKEVSIVTALGYLAGVCGKAWYIPQSGLNGYFILIAQSGVGKEALNTGVSLITSQLQQTIPASGDFVNMTKFASGPALRKEFTKNQCFVNINGEIGKIIKRMATDPAGGPMSSFRADLTDVYQKSGPSSRVSGVAYSNHENNTQTTTGVAFSIMGETTPSQFFESLTKDMMEDGFLSRWHIVQYSGDRPPLNKNPVERLSEDLYMQIATLVTQSLTLNSRYQNTLVQFDPNAEKMCDAYNDLCDSNINATQDEAIRQAWNRAHLKVLRLAALLATADNCFNPIVTTTHVQWAIDFSNHGLNLMLDRWKSGDIGVDDDSRNLAMSEVIRLYRTGKSKIKPARDDLKTLGVITKSDIVKATRNKSSFYKAREGHMRACTNVINDFVSMGALVPVTDQRKAELKFKGHCWYIMNDGDF